MGALREARCGIQGFVSAHSSRWLKQALPPTRAPHPGWGPFSLASLRGSEAWAHPYPQHHLRSAEGD